MSLLRAVLTMIDPSGQNRAFEYDEPRMCVVGRAKDCDIALPNEDPYRGISRHHCLLEMAPPLIRVRDLGSRNGTYVNGQRVCPDTGEDPADDVCPELSWVELEDGDELRVGNVVLQIRLETSVEAFRSLAFPPVH